MKNVFVLNSPDVVVLKKHRVILVKNKNGNGHLAGSVGREYLTLDLSHKFEPTLGMEPT